MRRFELDDGTSRKFWEIHLDEDTHSMRFGDFGTDGQTKTRKFIVAAGAKKDHDKLIADKLGEGYVEISQLADAPSDALLVTTLEDEKLTVSALAEKHPDWVEDLDSVIQLVRRDAKPNGLGPCTLPDHPLFEPWKDDILATACPTAALVPAPDGVPGPTSSFGGGTVAFLDSGAWPTCASCKAELEMVFQIASDIHRPWTRRDESLVAMYCFGCNPETSNEGKSLLAFVHPTTKVERARGARTARSVTLRAQSPTWAFPTSSWFSFRSTDSVLGGDLGGANSTLMSSTFIHDAKRIDVMDEYDGWVYPAGGRKTVIIPPRTAKAPDVAWAELGDYPNWAQSDQTPSCPDCEQPMLHVLDYNGEMFLDGALRVFMCDRGDCEREPKLAMAAEL